ncbi:MAG: hypothetical protein KKA62_05640 [Nanoarchaeota archaeon]|nr:hypothetical protein [Nanoarchaeota archaeon]MBU1644693.1 hypothetical protein [Nanoarchaeota archaeon]MBU1977406.1 hypothetical protein [Nanoarchaeota archaeon]
MNNKKAQIKYLGTIILVIATVMVIVIYFLPRISEAGQKASQLFNDGDCDADNVINSIDRCPCLTTAGLEHNTLRGCPLSITELEANRDKQSCGWFMTSENSCSGFDVNCYEKDNTAFVSTCGSKNENKCVEKANGKYKMRCDQVTETAVQVTLKKEQGLAGKWDLVPKEVKLLEGSVEKGKAETGSYGSASFDLGSSKTSQEVKLTVDVHNVGEENIPKSFTITVQVCNENRKEDSCVDKATKSLEPLASQRHRSEEISFTIGSEGDSCDGEGDLQCSIRVHIDSKDTLQELDENNNDAWIFVTLKNKKGEQVDWIKYQSIELNAQDDENQENYIGQVFQTCKEFVGESSCPSKDNDCNGEGEHSKALLTAGCLVALSEEDLSENDCGWAGAKIGSVIPNLGGKKIERATPITMPDGKDVEALFNYKWHSKAEGSLLCGLDKSWYLCDQAREGKVLVAGGERFRCKNLAWEAIQ